MAREHFRGALKKLVHAQAELSEFENQPPYIWIREKGGILQIVSFDPGDEGFDCELSVFPMSAPNRGAFPSMCLGVKLSSLAKLPFRRWPYDLSRPGTTRRIQACLRTLVEAGLPWFDRQASAEAIAASVHRNCGWTEFEYAGYCALQLDRTEEGLVHLHTAVDYLSGLGFNWSKARVAEMTSVMNLALDDPPALRQLLANNIAANRRILLKAFPEIPAAPRRIPARQYPSSIASLAAETPLLAAR